MEASDWIALAAVVAAVAGTTGTVIAALYARRSAESARRSADEAARLRRIEEERRAEERERWHHECEPDLPGVLETQVRQFTGPGPDDMALYGSITVQRVYRVRADAVSGSAWREIALDTLTKPNQRIDFVIERWRRGKSKADTEEVVFKFWPPVEGVDGAAIWACGCGRPGGERLAGDGHWERRIKVDHSRPRITRL